MSNDSPQFERLKEALRKDAQGASNLGIAFSTGRDVLPALSESETIDWTRRALVELLSEGSIVLFFAPWDEGFNLDSSLDSGWKIRPAVSNFEPLSAQEATDALHHFVQSVLSSPTESSDTDLARVLFFVEA